MGEKSSRVSTVTGGLLATLVTGLLAVTAMPPATAAPSATPSPTATPSATPAPSPVSAPSATPTTPPVGTPSLDPAAPTVPATVAPALQPAHFTVASFNVLGASHTKHSKRWASGSQRIVWVNKLLEKHHVDVAGFQEMQRSQLTKFHAITADAWGFYPGFSLKSYDSDNSVGWRKDRFDLVSATTVNIPYFNGKPRAMPLVLLREKASGMLAYFANYHNPAETRQYKNQGRWRTQATRVQIALQNQITPHGIPRFVTGDMNDRAPYFCRMMAGARLQAARPTSVYRDGRCQAGRPRAVDWILGARKMTFSGYSEDRSNLVDRTTDHPVISADVTIDPTRLPRAWAATPPPPVVPAFNWRSPGR